MIIRKGIRESILIMACFGLCCLISGCNWQREAREPGGVARNETAPEPNRAVTPSPATPGVSGTSNEMGPTGRDLTSPSGGSDHVQGTYGTAGNSGTTGGAGTGSGSSGGTTGKGPAPR
jgi:hypothetical protein